MNLRIQKSEVDKEDLWKVLGKYADEKSYLKYVKSFKRGVESNVRLERDGG